MNDDLETKLKSILEPEVVVISMDKDGKPIITPTTREELNKLNYPVVVVDGIKTIFEPLPKPPMIEVVFKEKERQPEVSLIPQCKEGISGQERRELRREKLRKLPKAVRRMKRRAR